MIVSVLLLALQQQHFEIPPIVESLLDDSHFRLLQAHPSGEQFLYECDTRPATLQFTLDARDETGIPGDLTNFDRFSARPPKSPSESRLASGFKFGAGQAGHRWNPGDFGDDIIVSGYVSQCRFQLRARIKQVNGLPTAEGRNDDDAAFLEGIARWTFGLAESRFCTPAQAVTDGMTFNALKGRAGQMHISAREFAQRTNQTYVENRRAGRALIGRGDSELLLVLGAPEVKVGSEWIPIDGVVIGRADQMYVPVAILE